MTEHESFTHSFIAIIDEICDEFQSAWQAGKSPKIGEFLESYPVDSSGNEKSTVRRDLLLLQLLLLELDYLSAQETEIAADVYLERFPDDRATSSGHWRHTKLKARKLRLGTFPQLRDPSSK